MVHGLKKFGFPIYATWCVTNLCNAKCRHCSTGAGSRLLNELSTIEAKRVIKEFADNQLFDLGFSGGEPLLRFDIFELLEYAVAHGIRVAIGTNGLLMTKEIAVKLRELQVTRVQVSVDGAYPQTHETIRGIKGIFTKAVNAIRICKEAGLPTYVCMTPMLQNYEEVTKVIDLAHDLNADGFNLSQFVPVGRGSKSLDLSPIQWKWVLTEWQRKRKELAGKMQMTAHEAQLCLVSSEFTTLPGFIGCQAGNGLCCITPGGDILPCVMMDLRIGNVKTKSFAEIWRSSTILKALQDREQYKGKCKSCNYLNVCGGCRAVAYAYSGDYLAEDPRCWYNPFLSSEYTKKPNNG